MRSSLRQFNCARCKQYCEIGGCCDRGNIYCGIICSTAARASSLLAAGFRYQQTFIGRLKHAARTAKWRAKERLKKESELKIVTHHSSPRMDECDVLQTPVERVFKATHGYCHFCGRYVGEWLRRSFYKRRGGVKRSRLVACSQGP